MFKKILPTDLPPELYYHIFSFLSNSDLGNINKTCINDLPKNNPFWKKKLLTEFHISIPHEIDAEDYYKNLHAEKQALREYVFLQTLLHKLHLSNFDEKRRTDWETRSENLTHVKLVLNEIVKECNIHADEKNGFKNKFDEALNILLLQPGFIKKEFFVMLTLLNISTETDIEKLHILENKLTNETTQDLSQELAAWAGLNMFAHDYNEFVIKRMIKRTGYTNLHDTLTAHKPLLSKKEARSLFDFPLLQLIAPIFDSLILLNAFHLFELLLNKQPELARCSSAENRDLLFTACTQRSVEIVNALVSKGADVNRNTTFSCRRHSSFIFDMFVSQKPYPTPLLMALLSAGTSITEAPDETVLNEFKIAKEIIHLLLQHGANPDIKSSLVDDGELIFPEATPRQMCEMIIKKNDQSVRGIHLVELANFILTFNHSDRNDNATANVNNNLMSKLRPQ